MRDLAFYIFTTIGLLGGFLLFLWWVAVVMDEADYDKQDEKDKPDAAGPQITVRRNTSLSGRTTSKTN